MPAIYIIIGLVVAGVPVAVLVLYCMVRVASRAWHLSAIEVYNQMPAVRRRPKPDQSENRML
jgi:hypothetical protein